MKPLVIPEPPSIRSLTGHQPRIFLFRLGLLLLEAEVAAIMPRDVLLVGESGAMRRRVEALGLCEDARAGC